MHVVHVSVTLPKSYAIVQAVIHDIPLPRCGIAMDAWMFPIHEDTIAAGTSKPLLFIEFQWQENVQKMLRLSREPDENGISTCQVLTI